MRNSFTLFFEIVNKRQDIVRRTVVKLDKKLSIIIPCYNVEKYIAECLESVCNARDAEVEVICVNDGSTDGTLSIIEQWKQKDDRIIIINQ